MMKLTIMMLALTLTNLVNATMVIAHRGASGYAPENTLSAIKKAIELGSTHIEIDVHQTQDGEVVAIHDKTVNRTTNGHGEVRYLGYDKIRELDAGSWFSNDFKGEKVPHLREVLEILPAGTQLIIEVKDGGWKYPKIENNIVDLVLEMGLQDQVILKSFSKDVLKKFQELAPEIPRLYVILGSIPWMGITFDTWFRFGNIFKEMDHVDYIQVHRYFLTQSFLNQAQERGLKVIVWDVHKPYHIKNMLNMGVDGIETDYPDRVLSNLK